jgi:transposase
LAGAGRQKATPLQIPENIYFVSLPPSAPELNPVEHLWDERRKKAFGNLVFNTLDARESYLEKALRVMELDKAKIKAIVAWAWIIYSHLI